MISYQDTTVASRYQGTTLDISAPATVQSDDLMIAIKEDNGTGQTVPPTGWTRVLTVENASGSVNRVEVFFGVHGRNGIGAGPYTFTISAPSGYSLIRLVSYRGVDPDTPMDVTPGSRANASGVTGTPGITTVTGGAMIVGAFITQTGARTWSGEAVAITGAMTERVESSVGSNLDIAVADVLQSNAGATGDSSGAMSANGANTGILLALRPAAVIISVTDSGSGTDSVSGISVTLGITDSGSGTDSISGISVALGVPDTGHGTDSVPAGTPEARIPLADAGHGADSLEAVTVEINLSETGQGTDSFSIMVSVPLVDSGAGVDLVTVMQGVLIAIEDSGHGMDRVSAIAVEVPVSDAGHGTDIIAAMSAVLSILDIGQGTDVVIRFDTAQDYKRVTVTFTGKTPVVTFKPATPGVTFRGRSPGVSFTNSTPGVTFTLKKPGIDLSMN